MGASPIPEYITIIGFGAIDEHDQLVKQNQIWDVTGAIHLLSIPFLGDRRYAALLQLDYSSSDSNPRFTAGDVLRIYFDAEKSGQEDDWRFQVVSYLPGAGSEDIQGLLFRKKLKDSDNFDHTFEPPAIPYDHADLPTQASTYAKADRIEVFVTHAISAKTLKKEIWALCQSSLPKNKENLDYR